MSCAGTYRALVCARDKVFSLAVRRSFASFGSRSVISLPVRLSGERNIAVGDGVFLGGGCWLQVVGEGAPGPAIEIGDRTSIAGTCTLSAACHVKLGRAVLLARGVYIADHDHAYADPSRPVLDQGIRGVAAVDVGDGAWLGQNVVVGPGVRIGAGAVVAANAVVRSDVPPYCLAAGAPARVVRDYGAAARASDSRTSGDPWSARTSGGTATG